MDSDAARPATDADRERVTGILREQMAAGRLALGDYQARLRRVRAAATAGELDAVLRDLPGRRESDEDERPRPAPDGTAGGPAGGPEARADGAGPAEARGSGGKRGGCGGAAALAVLSAAVCVLAGRAVRGR